MATHPASHQPVSCTKDEGNRYSLRRISAVLVLCLVSSAGVALCAPDTLALVGGQAITSEQFVNRFELSVYPGKEQGVSLERVKQKFLASMVAERLLSLDASRTDGAVATEFADLVRNSEDLFLRDVLFRKEVLDHVRIDDSEIRAGIRKSGYAYFLDAFYFTRVDSARTFYSRGRRMSGSALSLLADSAHISHDTLEIRFGEAPEVIERAFFGRSIGELSPPTLTGDGCVVFRIIQKEVDKVFARLSPTERTEAVRKIIRNRESEKLGFEYLQSVMKNVRVVVNYELFRPLARAIQAAISKHQPTTDDPDFHLLSDEISGFRVTFRRNLGDSLATWRGTNLPLWQVLQELPLSGFSAADTSLAAVTSGLHGALRFIIQNHCLAERARQLKLQYSGEVRYNVQVFVDAYLAARQADMIRSGVHVQPASVDSFLTKHNDIVLQSVLIKVKRYEAGSLVEAAGLYNKLIGERRRGSTPRDTSGEWVFASTLGESGAAVALLGPDDLYGPVQDGKKYVWFRLLDKRSPASRGELERSLRVAGEVLLEQKKRDALNERLAQLAEDAKVQMYYDRLKGVPVTPAQMISYRYIGFGGKIVAVPPVYPREEWIQHLRNRDKIIP